MKTTLLALSLLLLVGWCAFAQAADTSRPATPEEVQAVTDALKSALKDPDSAKVSGVRISADGKTACGFVNAKNSYGGYSGKSVFYAMGFKNKAGKPVYAVVGVDSGSKTAANIMCKQDGVNVYQ